MVNPYKLVIFTFRRHATKLKKQTKEEQFSVPAQNIKRIIVALETLLFFITGCSEAEDKNIEPLAEMDDSESAEVVTNTLKS